MLLANLPVMLLSDHLLITCGSPSRWRSSVGTSLESSRWWWSSELKRIVWIILILFFAVILIVVPEITKIAVGPANEVAHVFKKLAYRDFFIPSYY